MTNTAIEVVAPDAAEESGKEEVEMARPASVGEWAVNNARLLLALVIVLFLPYMFVCWGIALIVARGGCGG